MIKLFALAALEATDVLIVRQSVLSAESYLCNYSTVWDALWES